MKKQIEKLQAACQKFLELDERVEAEPAGTRNFFILRKMQDEAQELLEELCDPMVIAYVIAQMMHVESSPRGWAIYEEILLTDEGETSEELLEVVIDEEPDAEELEQQGLICRHVRVVPGGDDVR